MARSPKMGQTGQVPSLSPFFPAAVNPLNSHQIALVEASFRKISRNGEQASSLFFTRLFEFDPSLRHACGDDFAAARRFFVRLLGTIVHRLESFDAVRDHLRELALAEPGLAEREEHHHSVGAAFFWMLQEVLGRDFTPETYGAWMTVFRILSNEAKAAVRELELAS
jgi:hemoglobin-like flavoprotein